MATFGRQERRWGGSWSPDVSTALRRNLVKLRRLHIIQAGLRPAYALHSFFKAHETVAWPTSLYRPFEFHSGRPESVSTRTQLHHNLIIIKCSVTEVCTFLCRTMSYTSMSERIRRILLVSNKIFNRWIYLPFDRSWWSHNFPMSSASSSQKRKSKNGQGTQIFNKGELIVKERFSDNSPFLGVKRVKMEVSN